jgi:hypothetical protein
MSNKRTMVTGLSAACIILSTGVAFAVLPGHDARAAIGINRCPRRARWKHRHVSAEPYGHYTRRRLWRT